MQIIDYPVLKLRDGHLVRLADQQVRRSALEHRAGSLVELGVALRCLLQRDGGGVDVVGDAHPVVKDRHHQLPVVAHHRALTGEESVRLGPAEPEAQQQRAFLGGLVGCAGVAGDLQARDAQLAARG